MRNLLSWVHPGFSVFAGPPVERIGRTNCVIATAFLGNAPPHAIPLVSDNGQYVNFDGLCLVKRHFTAEACRWLRNFCTPEPGIFAHLSLIAAFQESSRGSLVPGKLADITVLSKDILTIPEDEIPAAVVNYTIVGGKILYQRQPAGMASAKY